MQKDLAKNAVVPFIYEDSPVRTITDEKNESWFCLKDVCKILGIGNPSDVVKRLDEKGVERIETLTAGGVQAISYVNEPNLYRTIFRSDKPDAVNFQTWVFEVVLPQIRKTGSYSGIKGRLDDQVYEHAAIQKISDSYSKTLAVLGITGNAAVIAVNQEIMKLTGGEINPLASSGNTYLLAEKQEQLYTATEIGKKVGLTARQVNVQLYAAGYQQIVNGTKGKRYYELTEKGKVFGKYLDTGKRHGNGQPVRSIKWLESIIGVKGLWNEN